MNKAELVQQLFPSTFLRATRDKDKLDETDLLQGIIDSTVILYNCTEAALSCDSTALVELNSKASELATRLTPMLNGYTDAVRLAALVTIIQKITSSIMEDIKDDNNTNVSIDE